MKTVLHIFAAALFLSACHSAGQINGGHTYKPDTSMLAQAFDTFREPTIIHRRFKHADVEPLILKRKDGGVFTVEQLGQSVQKRPIYQLQYGSGDKKVMLWSQMHGNEPTATMALMDLFNFLEGKEDTYDDIRTLLREKTSLYFIPMLNPDGAEIYNRRNAQDIDVNRDARQAATPEARILKNAAEKVKPRYGFNLHDQNIYYNVPGTPNPVTIALLAPAYNEAREVNDIRGGAMKIAAGINRILQGYVPNAVAKYDDTFTPRGFGDNFQSWGASTVLIESGGYKGDPEKQFIRKLNFIIILNSLIEIAQGSYEQYAIEEYEQIPFNASRLSDLVLRNVTHVVDSVSYTTDLAIKRDEYSTEGGNYYVRSRIDDIGDLQDDYGYEELDASGLHFMEGKVYEKAFANPGAISMSQAYSLLRQGYYAVRVQNMPADRHHSLPLLLLNKRTAPGASPNLGREANFFLAKDGKPIYAVVNGYLVDLEKEEAGVYRNYVF